MAVIRLADTKMLDSVVTRYQDSNDISEKVKVAINTTKKHEEYVGNI